jgi:hypothetical protein
MRLAFLTAAVALASAYGPAGVTKPPSCAQSTPTLTASASASKHQLVPPGATSVLLCRYRGLNPAATAHRLARARLVANAVEVKRFITELDGLPELKGRVPCPMDDGSEITATFDYSHAATATVSVGLTGCRMVSNGRLTRTAESTTGARLLDQLMKLVG